MAKKSTQTKSKKNTSKTKTTKNNKPKSTSTTKKAQPAKKVAKKTATPISKEKKKIKLSNTLRDKELVDIIVKGMQEKKANNITILDLKNIENSFCNYFVICEAESKPQLQTITDSVEEFTTKKLNIRPHHVEGLQNAEWILLDYLTVVAHIFRSDVRNYYQLEQLWADATIQHINNN
ncbi:MAG: hypothetical protein KatS3mg027_2092 [Bacteroidia bacterium]|nr:MAG: hypothetical protein KatS3mg027_2092 [Bacteroidia bacterium]